MTILGVTHVRLYTPNNKCNQSGERIRQARKKKGWSQGELAEQLQLAGLDIGQIAVSRMETGKRVIPDYELPILAEVLHVTVYWLLGIKPKK